MELEEANNNLHAITLLYRLLEDNSLSLQNANSEDLIDRARGLLKSMMDVAAERVFETRLKIMARQASISETPCSFRPEKSDASWPLKPLVGANSSQCSVQYPTCSRISSQNDELSQLKLPAKKAVPGLYKCSISGNGGTNRKTPCSLGEESSMMQKLVDARNLSNGKAILPNKQQHNVSTFQGVGEHANEPLEIFEAKASESNEVNEIPLLNRMYEVQGKPSASSWVEPQNKEGDFSDDVVNTIKRIKSRIKALQLCSNLVDSTKYSSCHHGMHIVVNSDSPAMQRKDGIADSQLSSGRSLLVDNMPINLQSSQPPRKVERLTSANAFEVPISSGNKFLSQVALANQNRRLQTSVELAKRIDIPRQFGRQKGEVGRATQFLSGGQELPAQNSIHAPTQNMTVKDRVELFSQSVSGNDHLVSQASECIQGLRVPSTQDDLTTRQSMPVDQTPSYNLVRKIPVARSDTDCKVSVPKPSHQHKLMESKVSTISRREKKPPHQMVIRPTLLDQRSSEIKVSSHLYRDRSVLERRGTLEISNVGPQKRRVLPKHHESEESVSSSGSFADWTSQRSSDTSDSDSDDYSLPGEIPSRHYMGPTSGKMADVSYGGSSEDGSDAYPYKDEGPLHRLGSFKSYRSHVRKGPKKTIGHLRGLKNKLGLIFHHHHHHHHYNDHVDTNHSQVVRRHSMWNRMKNIFHHKNKHGVLPKHNVGKTRLAAARMPRRKQVGQLHGLVEGLLRHIRYSKKPEPSKFKGVKGSNNAPFGHRKKLHWWQTLQRHQVVKLNNRARGRLKIGFKSQKSLRS